MERFGPYDLEQLIGRGGMGEVYRAVDRRKGRTVAIKRLPRELAEDQDFRRRFEREARIASRLQHPHVVPIHDYSEIDGHLYLEMPYLVGRDLEQLIAKRPLPPELAVDIVAQIASALDAAHGNKLVHRDVKPSNVLLVDHNSPAGYFAYLLDFGIAARLPGEGSAATATSSGIGTPGYIAPERINGVEGDPRSDVYSLACLLFACLTGQAPFVGDYFHVMGAHLSATRPRPSERRPGLPTALDDVVMRGMAREPNARYQRAGELAAAATAALRAQAETTVPAPDPTVAARTRIDRTPRPAARPKQRQRLLYVVAAVVVVVFGASALLLATRHTPSANVGRTPPASTFATSTPAASSTPASTGTPTTSGLPAPGTCLTLAGVATECAAMHRYEVIGSASRCSAAAVVSYLGGDPALDVGYATGKPADGVCVVSRGDGADVSVTARDVFQRPADADAWRLCVNTRLGTRTGRCDLPHTGEYTGTGGAVPNDASCASAATAYLGIDFSQVADQLKATALPPSDPNHARRLCLVLARGTAVLVASLRDIGTSALPFQ